MGLRWRQCGGNIARRCALWCAMAVALGACGTQALRPSRAAVLPERTSMALVGEIPSKRGESLAEQRRYAIAVTPDFDAGSSGVCVAYDNVGRGGYNACGGAYPTNQAPLFGLTPFFFQSGEVPAGGAIQWVLTGPGVTAVGIGRFAVKTIASTDLPAGDRAAVFFAPGGTRSNLALHGSERVKLITEGVVTYATAIGASHRAMPSDGPPAALAVRHRYWHSPASPAQGACALRIVRPERLRAVWGEVAVKIGTLHSEGAAFFSCLNTWFVYRGHSVEVALLLDARSPGAEVQKLWGSVAIARAPGFVAVGYASLPNELRKALGGPLTARRVQNMWLVARGGSGTAFRISLLKALAASRG